MLNSLSSVESLARGLARVNLAFLEDELPKIALIESSAAEKGEKNYSGNFIENLPVQIQRRQSEISSSSRRKSTNPLIPVKRITRISTQIFAAMAANVGAFALGTVLSWTSGGLPSIRESHELDNLTIKEESWIGSIAALGALAACPFAGYGISTFGRRMTMLLLTAPFIGGWAFIYCANHIGDVYVGRFLTGFCGGAFTILTPVFIAETADDKIRGSLASGIDLMTNAGMLYIFVIGAYTSWHIQALLCGIIPVVFHILMMLVPESPRYLVERRDYEKATQSLAWLYGMNKDKVQEDLKVIITSVEESKTRPITFRKIIMKMSVLKPILVCFGIIFFTVISGYDAITFYTTDIFKSTGTSLDPQMSTIILGVIQVLASIPAALIVDKYGRRFLLILSEVFIGISLGIMGAYFFIKRKDVCQWDWCSEAHSSPSLSWIPLISLTVFLISYSLGIGPLSLMMTGELLPTHIKGLASCLVLSFRWLLGFGVTKFFQDLVQILGAEGCYWIFSGSGFLGCIFVYFCVPETKGKSLDEIQLFFVNPDKLKKEKMEEICDDEKGTPFYFNQPF